MTPGTTLVTSLLATLAHPTTWVLALAGFLVRGGIVAFLVPILVLPTPVGLANLAGPTLVEFVFGGFSPTLVVLIAAGVGGVLAWIVFGGFLAATIEVEGIRIVAGDEDVAARSPLMDHDARREETAETRDRDRCAAARLRPDPPGAPDPRRPDGHAVPAPRPPSGGRPRGPWPSRTPN